MTAFNPPKPNAGRWLCPCGWAGNSDKLIGYNAGLDANRNCPRCRRSISTMTDRGGTQ